ncbi:MAG: sorbosone dehydrogenase family protein [Lysobacterales bacterium]|nr:MAG: sorbosone dehydrogenase family protein [Xanthomonadales bacterium]
MLTMEPVPRKAFSLLFCCAFLAAACEAPAAGNDLQEKLALIRLPPGFEISVYAEGVENARQLALGDRGTVFAGSREAGKVHAVVDRDGDQRADRVRLVAEGLEMPSGLEFRQGSLYVAALDRILRYDDIEQRLEQPPEPVLVAAAFPDKSHHGWKYLRFGPDGLLYVPVGAPCNICDEPGFAEIRRIRADGTGMETFARGVRNSVGLAFHPDSGELWFTDNGRDMLGDDLPGDELNHAPAAGAHFGYPYCHQGDTPDPEFGAGKSCADYAPPALTLGAHVAPLGLAFYTADMFPEAYRKQLFIAQHGSWNRSAKVGYNVLLVRFDDAGRVAGSEVFASGWLQGEDNWGRPSDVLQMPDGSLLLADDQAGAIYRISYREQAR